MPPSTRPKVTFGLPVYNSQELVARAIDAVLAQSAGDFELLISDNCSTDATEQICRDYARRDSRVHYTRTERNLGAAANFARLVELAQTEYFKWICHDDWISPDFIAQCLPIAESNPEIVTVAPVVDVVDDAGNKLLSLSSHVGRRQWSRNRLEQYRQMMDELAYCETHDDGLLMVAYAYGFHRLSLLRRTRLIMPFFCSDYVLAAELALAGRLVAIDAPLSRFMISVSSEGSSSNFSNWNPGAIQRMLTGRSPSAIDVQLAVRRRHLEHVVAVLRTSSLTASEKALAVEAAMRPALARFTARLRKRWGRGANARAGTSSQT